MGGGLSPLLHPPFTPLHSTPHRHSAFAPALVVRSMASIRALWSRLVRAVSLGKGKRLLAARSRPSKISLQYPPKTEIKILVPLNATTAKLPVELQTLTVFVALGMPVACHLNLVIPC